MKRVFILKIGSFIDPVIGDTSSIGLITGEPVNFGKLLYSLGYEVYLASDQNIYDGNSGMNYFDLKNEWKTFAQQVRPDDIVLLWQGGYYDQEHTPLCVRHYQFVKIVQDKKLTEKQYFMLTDTRLPLMNFGKFLKNNSDDFRYLEMFNYTFDDIDIDVSQITMLSQASKVWKLSDDIEDGYFKMKGRYDGNAMLNHKEIVHIPMYLMPLFTHSSYEYSKFNLDKNYTRHDLIFTVQSLEYFDEYRMSRLFDLMIDEPKLSKYDTAIYGKHNRKAMNVLYDFIEKRDDTVVNLPKMMKPVKFGEMKDLLRNTTANLCISEKPYVNYDLLPNRIFESFATGCIPIIDDDIVFNTQNDFIREYCSQYVPSVNKGKDVARALDNIKLLNQRQNSIDFFNREMEKIKMELPDAILRIFG